MADLPGLIEGAHVGKGLGLQFLRHIERCRVIVHIIDLGESGRDPYEDYQIINNELLQYGFGLENRPRIIVASKMDEDGAEDRLKELQKKIEEPIIPISAVTDEGIEKLIYKCADLIESTPLFPLYDSEEKDLDMRVYTLEDEEKEFYIKRPESRLFVIYGDKIEKFYKMTNISTDAGMMKLITHLRRLGIDDELERMGAQDGDTVRLCDFEFEYVS
jgi:GTP-binding protein